MLEEGTTKANWWQHSLMAQEVADILRQLEAVSQVTLLNIVGIDRQVLQSGLQSSTRGKSNFKKRFVTSRSSQVNIWK